jgi:membrane protease YdiL (CAAX protease family)
MSSALKIFAYFLGTLLLGAVLAPPLFWAGHALGGSGESLRWLRETDFQRYFNRAMFIAALALLWPTVRALHIGSWRELGLRRNPRAWRHLALGFLLAGGLLWVLGLIAWSQRIYIPNPKGLPGVGTVLGFLLTAAVVGAAEEGFFRGVLLGLVARTARPAVALWFVSAFFALVHFLKPDPNAIDPHEVNWASGFALLPHAFWQWRDPALVLGGFATLLAAALIAGWARLRTGSLWLPIGLHAGWIFGLKSFSRSSKHLADSNLWFGDNLLIGLGPLLTLLATGGIVWAWLRRDAPPPSIDDKPDAAA